MTTIDYMWLATCFLWTVLFLIQKSGTGILDVVSKNEIVLNPRQAWERVKCIHYVLLLIGTPHHKTVNCVFVSQRHCEALLL